jgi:hypothetical protein
MLRTFQRKGATMPTMPVKLLTVVAESVLADRLTRTILAAGALGYTVTPAKGVGDRNRRSKTLGGDNVRIEVIADAATALGLLKLIAEEWFPHYAVVAWLADIEVMRGEKYAAPKAEATA